LLSAVRQAVLNCTGTVIDVENLPAFLRGSSETKPSIANVDEVNRHDAPTIQATLMRVEEESNQPKILGNDSTPLPSFTEPNVDVSAVNHHPSTTLAVESLDQFIDQQIAAGTANLYAEALERMERQVFTRVLTASGGNQSRASEILGITRGKVRDRIATFGIHVEKTISFAKSSATNESN
jgi:DNA-binding protein Fis